jgi:hypothetical protein
LFFCSHHGMAMPPMSEASMFHWLLCFRWSKTRLRYFFYIFSTHELFL